MKDEALLTEEKEAATAPAKEEEKAGPDKPAVKDSLPKTLGKKVGKKALGAAAAVTTGRPF